MRRKLHMLTALLVLTAAALIVVAGILIHIAKVDVGSSSEWASWVQAFGGIAGIVAAIWISREDIRRANRAKAEEDRALLRSVRQVVERAKLLVTQLENCQVWEDLAGRCDPQDLKNIYRAFMARDAREIYAVLAAFPIERLAGIGMIDIVISVRRAMGEIAEQMQYYNFDPSGKLTAATRQQFMDPRNMVNDAWVKTRPAPGPA